MSPDCTVISRGGENHCVHAVGDRIQVRAYKSDGTCYRWWYATVEAVETDRVVVINPSVIGWMSFLAPGHQNMRSGRSIG